MFENGQVPRYSNITGGLRIRWFHIRYFGKGDHSTAP